MRFVWLSDADSDSLARTSIRPLIRSRSNPNPNTQQGVIASDGQSDCIDHPARCQASGGNETTSGGQVTAIGNNRAYPVRCAGPGLCSVGSNSGNRTVTRHLTLEQDRQFSAVGPR